MVVQGRDVPNDRAELARYVGGRTRISPVECSRADREAGRASLLHGCDALCIINRPRDIDRLRDSRADRPHQGWDVLSRTVGQEIETMHAFAAGEERRAGDDLLDRPLENARMTDYPSGKRAILDGRPGEHRQNVVNAPATEQDVDADLHGSPSRRDLALAVEGDDLEVGRRAPRLDGQVQGLELGERQADVLEPDMPDSEVEGRPELLLRIVDRAVVARQHEDEAESHHDALLCSRALARAATSRRA